MRNAVPNVIIESVSSSRTERLHRVFSIQISDGRTLSLNTAPHSLRFLRSEQRLVLSEALVVHWILQNSLELPGAQAASFEKQRHRRGQQSTPPSSSPSTDESRPRDDDVSHQANDDIIKYLPTLLVHSSQPTELGLAFNILEPTRGCPISSLAPPLTEAERGIVDFQKGQMMRRLASHISPTRKFGLVAMVLGPPLVSPMSPVSSEEDSWRKAFHSLLEGILRDGEDLAVTISYQSVRRHFDRLGHLLDAVTAPRLVVLDAGEDDNVLVSRSQEVFDERDEARPKTHATEAKHDPKHAAGGQTVSPQQRQPYEGQPEKSNPAPAPSIAVSGLHDWSSGVFGDILFSTIFTQNPTSEFMRGFYHPHRASPPQRNDYPTDISSRGTDNAGYDHEEEHDDIIEDRDNAPIRLLLYECYHAMVCIVKQYYRPSADSNKQEIAARRRLTAALARLDDVDEYTYKRPRRSSGDARPVKRARGDTPEVNE
ncbi:Uu.00g137630.m01.CDS01 [Anthostomella pinea]|uniref:Uu.00g137630.m01.CDS01 n=1 Tax=Anthostomella pinea TaxID=933095 RepID=A0AAI8VPK7_9PEZI|nr:Uu.00g137630.m01.CDS01 [Anthostomella pinea]